MQNFSSLASSQTDKFLTIFEENFRIFQVNSLENSNKFIIWVRNFLFNLAMHVHAIFQLSNLYPDGLGQIFSRKIQDFLKENLEFSKFEKSSE
jgi:hypothetical protein